ncbi:disintegrin and metalloproteinase domain-containing protein 8 isoform X2 [Chlorocebus sabaeus]|uniref:disintegrin and metalloproteinase domain-containing protein 8 isoform X2 n=1 Tax=Chlorocebus sabaeus TaxID=60711 RepID=UPI003BF9AD4E
MRDLGLWLLCAMALPAIAHSRPWARVERYEVVLPQRLPGPRVRRALPSHVGLYPERVSYVLGATGQNFTLHLRKNRDLLGSGYRETYTAANGSEVTEQLRRQDHCFYQGHVEGHPDSAASLSTCAGLRGFFQVGSDLHLIEPLDEGGEGGRHAVYQAEHLLQTAGTCGVSDDSLGSLLGPRTAAVFRPQPGGSLPSRGTRYVELYVVADNAEFQMLGSEAAVRHRVLEVVNHVDKVGSSPGCSGPGCRRAGCRGAGCRGPGCRGAGCRGAGCRGPGCRGPGCGGAGAPGGRWGSVATGFVPPALPLPLACAWPHLAAGQVQPPPPPSLLHLPPPRLTPRTPPSLQLYQKLNFRVVLVGLEIWNRQDRFHVSPDPNVTLENLLAWQARRLTQRHLQDNVQLITGVDFTGTTVGLARVSAMCSHSSGAVNQDHSKNPVGVACTMAHEMGHNLGMDHDENVQGCRCREPSEAGRCIMAGSIGSTFPRMFSDCSRAYLEGFLEQPQSACLANAPDLSHLVGGPVCGNLFVERGEQCDCGPPEDCRNHCCNSTTCQLTEGAQCAHGTCCHECRVKPAGEPCRPKKDTCDLEEFCDGRHPECPEDAFQENGTPCFGGYCYNGTCPTLTQQCQTFWGPGGRAAEESCFSYDILPGCKTSWYRADLCGVLQCKGGQHPPGRTSCILNHVCHALTTEDGTAYELVPEGTRCGPEKVCWKGRCQDLHVYRSRNCSAQCHNHGVCNHKQECHCHAGWAPPYCAKLLTEVHAASGSLPVIVVVVLVLLAVVVTLAGIIVYRKARSRIPSRNTTPKTTTGLSNPLFHQAASHMPAKQGAPAPTRGPQEQVPTTHTGQPTRHPASSVALKRPPPAPPATVSRPPFPVPVYAQQAPKQVIKPTFAPPAPPVKPGARATKPGPAESAVGPKVALKPPIQRKQGARAPTAP